VKDVGGLHVIGTTRHHSRRIDRQLRGRSGRLGDPGSSKFFVSFEDSLMRLFASPRMTALLQRFRPPEGEPISATVLNKSIETAQKRVEQRNYMMRKHTLEYDDVMNRQRQATYAFRNEILHIQDINLVAKDVLEEVCQNAAYQFFSSREGSWDVEGFREYLMHLFPITFDINEFDEERLEPEEIAKIAAEKVIAAFEDKMKRENSKVDPKSLPKNVPEMPAESAIRNLMVRKNDHLWQEHLLAMDHLRTDVSLRSVGQKDPLTEFKHEAFSLYEEFTHNLKKEIAHDLFRFELVRRDDLMLQQLIAGLKLETNRSFMPELDANANQK